MSEKRYTGSDLENALKKGELRSSRCIAGFVKESSVKGYVSFSMTNGRQWIDMPTKMIESAEQLSVISSSIDDPTVRITLREPGDAEAKVLLALLSASMENLARHMEADTVVARQAGGSPSAGGVQWLCCKRGKAYVCGCLPGGVPMLCCDEWEPCPVIKNPLTGVISL